MEIETKIWLAVKGHITALAGTVPVAWPGSPLFTPPTSGGQLSPYLAVGTVAAAPQRQVIAHRQPQLRVGVLTVVYVAPLGPDVAALIEQAAKALVPYFREGTCILYENVSVEFTAEPAVQDGYRDDGYWRIPVTINWRARVAP